MQKNLLKRGNSVAENAMVCKHDTKILKGDVFECI